MTRATTNLGGTASDVVVSKVGHGLMMMTWKPEPSPKDECFEAIKAGIDALPPGAKMVLDGGEFYGHNFSTANLDLIAEFFETYPDYAERAFLSVKGGLKYMEPEPDSSPENLARSVSLINAKLRGTKRLDLFECARVDPKVSVEDTIATLVKLKDQGKFDHIGMSECSAKTLRRGHKVHPISIVEIEISPFSYEQHTRDVIAAAKELGVAVAGYSPLGRGFLTGQIKRPEDIPVGDFRRQLPRFQEDSMKYNFAIVDALTEVAKKHNVTPAQLCIAWVSSLGPHVIPIPGSSHAKRTLENCAGGDIEFSKVELEEINGVIDKADVKGLRYPAHVGGLWA
ncbi:Aldo/keto reductase [Imleria badia]|nr:Aldo/keto reductase [Imleria badia]